MPHDTRTEDQLSWDGVERRSGDDRRSDCDRREEIRFEPHKPNRRHNTGRRKEDFNPWRKAFV